MQVLPERPIRRLVTFIHRHPYLTSLLSLAVAALSVLLAAGMLVQGTRLELRSRIQDLLPGSAPSVQASEVLEKRLGSADILVVTLMTDDFVRVKEALPEITRRVEALPDVRKARFKQDVSTIDQNALIIFPSLPELREYYEDLTSEIQKAVDKTTRIAISGGKVSGFMLKKLSQMIGQQMTVEIMTAPIGLGVGQRCTFVLEDAFLEKAEPTGLVYRPSELPDYTCK